MILVWNDVEPEQMLLYFLCIFVHFKFRIYVNIIQCRGFSLFRFFAPLFEHNKHTAYHQIERRDEGGPEKKNVQEITSYNTDKYIFFFLFCNFLCTYTHNRKILNDDAIYCTYSLLSERDTTAVSAIAILDAYPPKLFKTIQISFCIPARLTYGRL